MVLTKVIIRMDLPMMEAMMMVPTTNLMTMEAKNTKNDRRDLNDKMCVIQVSFLTLSDTVG